MSDPVTIVLLGKPVPSAQASVGKSGHRFVPRRQSEAVAQIRVAASEMMQDRPMLTGPIRFQFLAEMPIPRSWSQKKRDEALLRIAWPITKPDLKNLAALVEDALKSVVYADDNQVCEHHSRKLYGAQPKIVVTVSELS